MAKSPKTFTSHSPPRARTLSGPATRRRSTRELLQSRNRAFGPNGVPTTSRQTSATRTDTTSRSPTSLGSTCAATDRLFRLEPQLLDDRPPFRGVGLLHGGERRRRLLLARKDLDGDFGKTQPHRG